MASQIYLTRMHAGQPKKYTLTKSQKEYVDQNHQYISPAMMAENLHIPAITVLAYFNEKGYRPVRRNRKPPVRPNDGQFFDFDKYSKTALI